MGGYFTYSLCLLLAHYWNTPDDSFRYLDMKNDLGVLSRGDQIMATFFMSVWSAENEGFDFLDEQVCSIPAQNA